MYEKLIESASNKYIKAGGQKGILEISALAQGDKDFEKKYTKLMNEHFKSYFNANDAVLPLWEGMKFVPTTSDSAKKTTNEITDISKLVDDAMSRAAQAFKSSSCVSKGRCCGDKRCSRYAADRVHRSSCGYDRRGIDWQEIYS